MMKTLLLLSLLLNAFSVLGFSASVVIAPSDDAQAAEGYPSSNYGSGTSIFVASDSAGRYRNERGWVKFDLNGQFSSEAAIQSAVLRLYCWKADPVNPLTVAVHGSDVDSWDEAALTWNNQPAFGPQLDSLEMLAGTTGVWYEWDVTAFVQDQQAVDGVVSLVVKAVTENQSPARTFAVEAKEFSASLVPQLVITYEGGQPSDTIKIFHTNDMHSRLLAHEFDVPDHHDVPVFERIGGAACLTSKMIELKTDHPDSLILDAGDISEGSPLGDQRGNGGMIDFLVLLDTQLKTLGGRGFDALVVGNHDVRAAEMIGNMQNSGLPFISVNVCHNGTKTPFFDAYKTVTIHGKKIGILGYTNDESSYLDGETDQLLDIVKCVWEDSSSSTIDLKDKVNMLRTTEGCDIVILLAHIGQSRQVCGSDALVKDTGGVDPPSVIISGHWHSSTETVWRPSHLNEKTIIAEAASYMQMIGELDISHAGRYVNARKHWIRTDEITPDPAVESLIADLVDEYNASGPVYGLYDVIGFSADDLTLDKDKWWTGNEFPWSGDNKAGGWICDSMVWKAADLGYTCQLALQSGGGIRRDVPAGPVTYLQIYETYPWPDDNMVRVSLTGQELWNFIENDYCGTSISRDWLVTADDGLITGITYLGVPIDPAGRYDVVISQYMYDHPKVPWSDTTPENLGYSIRQSAIDYTGRFDEQNPMRVTGPRYNLNTEFAGGFRAVVTMMNDAESEPYHEDGFIRFIGYAGETLQKRADYGLSNLLNPDGTIDYENPLSEIMYYRSHLGFPNGVLRNGDIIEIWGEGGFFDGNPQFVDQEGIWDAETEIKVIGHDPSLAIPEFYGFIHEFWNDRHENHYVKFYAEKVSSSAVKDSRGQSITVYQQDGFDLRTLPGNAGDLLELTGVQTESNGTRKFHCSTAVISATNGYPPHSRIEALLPPKRTADSVTLSVSADDAGSTSSGGTVELRPSADAYVAQNAPNSNYGTSVFLYAKNSSGKNRRSWVRFDLGSIPPSANVTSATLKFHCASADSSDLPVSVHCCDNDSWTESSITWNNQPAFGSVQAAGTLSAGQSDAWYAWDVKSCLQSEMGLGDTAVSFVVKPAAEDAANENSYLFNAKEFNSGAMGPILEVRYDSAGGARIVQVKFFYRYAADGTSWSPWTLHATDASAPWSVDFDNPNGYGHYEFYSVAVDDDGNTEEAPFRADTKVYYSTPSCPVFDGRSRVDLGEFAVLAGEWLETGTGLKSDLIDDQIINAKDFLVIAELWLQDCE